MSPEPAGYSQPAQGARTLNLAFEQDMPLNNLPGNWAFVKLGFGVIRDAGLFRL
jgi:hypothetical protein